MGQAFIKCLKLHISIQYLDLTTEAQVPQTSKRFLAGDGLRCQSCFLDASAYIFLRYPTFNVATVKAQIEESVRVL